VKIIPIGLRAAWPSPAKGLPPSIDRMQFGMGLSVCVCFRFPWLAWVWLGLISVCCFSCIVFAWATYEGFTESSCRRQRGYAEGVRTEPAPRASPHRIGVMAPTQVVSSMIAGPSGFLKKARECVPPQWARPISTAVLIRYLFLCTYSV
jgi:hypothetical protein